MMGGSYRFHALKIMNVREYRYYFQFESLYEIVKLGLFYFLTIIDTVLSILHACVRVCLCVDQRITCGNLPLCVSWGIIRDCQVCLHTVLPHESCDWLHKQGFYNFILNPVITWRSAKELQRAWMCGRAQWLVLGDRQGRKKNRKETKRTKERPRTVILSSSARCYSNVASVFAVALWDNCDIQHTKERSHLLRSEREELAWPPGPYNGSWVFKLWSSL